MTTERQLDLFDPKRMWQHVTDLPDSLATHAAFGFAENVYVVGGVEDDSAATEHVRRARYQYSLPPSLGPWEDALPLPNVRAHSNAAPVHEGRVHSVGGAADHASSADVYVGQFQ